MPAQLREIALFLLSSDSTIFKYLFCAWFVFQIGFYFLFSFYTQFWIFLNTLQKVDWNTICTLRHSLLRSSTINPLQVLGICMLKAEVLMKELLLTREMINKRMLNTVYCKYLSIIIWVEKKLGFCFITFLTMREGY